MNSGPILSVDRVSKRFSTVLAVDELSFEVRRGEIFALLGPNGAGKSTTVRMVAGITQPDSGSIAFDAEPGDGAGEAEAGRGMRNGVGVRAARRLEPSRLGYLPEERGLYPDQRVMPTLTYFASLRGVEPAAAQARAREWLARFELDERANDKVSALSKGNQQKVQFIASVLHQPVLAVLDEPFSGFDPVNQDLVSEMIRELRDGGMTIVLSAHHMDLVESLADYVLLMHRGRAILRGSMAEIRASSGMGRRLDVTVAREVDVTRLAELSGVERVLSSTASTARLALAQDASLSSVIAALGSAVDVIDIATDTPSLREIYLAAVSDRGLELEDDSLDDEELSGRVEAAAT